MFGLVFGILFILGAIAVRMLSLPTELRIVKNIGSIAAIVVGLLFAGGGAIGYNDAGFCQHTRTIFGTETSTCNTGWYFAGWGNSTAWLTILL